MNITITGNLGSGKSSVCKELKAFGHEIISAGDVFRQVAQEKGLSIVEMNELAKKDPSVDKQVDDRTIQLNAQKENAVFDSRLAWHFAPDSFKVFLVVELDEAARRTFDGAARDAEEYSSLEETREKLAERAELEKERYRQLYNLDYYDLSNYDLVIESTNAAPDAIAREIERNYQEYKECPFGTRLELNLRCMYPTQPFETLNTGTLDRLREQEEALGSLCAAAPVMLAGRDGYSYLVSDHHNVFAAIRAGKSFGLVTSYLGKVEPAAQPLLSDFETYGGFAYRHKPDSDIIRGYNVDLSFINKEEE